MGRPFHIRLMIGALFTLALVAVTEQGAARSGATQKVPAEYEGNWVCQTSKAGYNVLAPHADISQPLTNKVTTPSSVVIIKFTLNGDGTYEAAKAKGRYSYDGATKTISWKDGPHESGFTKTNVGNRKDGAPSINFVHNTRYYGCFKSKTQKPKS